MLALLGASSAPARPCSGTPTAAWSRPPRRRGRRASRRWCSTSRRWEACSPRTSGSSASGRASPPATATAPSPTSSPTSGGYSQAEIDAMRGTPGVGAPGWRSVPTVDQGAAQAEGAYTPAGGRARAASGCPRCMLVGSREPGVGAPLDRGLRGGDPGRRGRDARGPGPRRHLRAPPSSVASRAPAGSAGRDLLVLADDLPGRVGGVHEVRRLAVAQGVVVVVVLLVAAVDAAAARRCRPVPRNFCAIAPLTVSVPEVVAAVPVVDDERVVEGQDRGVDLDVPGAAVVVAVAVVVVPVVRPGGRRARSCSRSGRRARRSGSSSRSRR